MPFAVAALIVGLAVVGVAAIVFGLVVSLRWIRGARSRALALAGGAALIVGVGILVVGEVLPRTYAQKIPADDPCLPDGIEVALDRTPIALRSYGGSVQGEASLDAQGVRAVVADALQGTALEEGDPQITFTDGEIVLAVALDVSVFSLPVEARIEPELADGALQFTPTNFSAVGLDLPDWAVGLVDDQLKDSDSLLSQALAPGEDDPCALDSGAAQSKGSVRLTSITVDDAVHVRFEVGVA